VATGATADGKLAGLDGVVAGWTAAGGANIDGLPLCLFQASHNRTRDIKKTAHNRVRRKSVMGNFWKKKEDWHVTPTRHT